MELIDAFWDSTNLGVKTLECVLANEDCQDIEKTASDISLQTRDFEYIVVKMPVGQIALGHCLEDLGFRFMEVQLQLGMTIKDARVPEKYKAICDEVSLAPVTDQQDRELLVSKIEDDTFLTDRISLDPHFSPRMAATRYKNWISNCDAKSHCLHWIVFQGHKAGFVFLREDGKRLHGLLSAVFPEYQFQGVGIAIASTPLQYGRGNGFKKYMTAISSNNMPVFKIFSSFGYHLYGTHQVYRWLKKP